MSHDYRKRVTEKMMDKVTEKGIAIAIPSIPLTFSIPFTLAFKQKMASLGINHLHSDLHDLTGIVTTVQPGDPLPLLPCLNAMLYRRYPDVPSCI